VELPEAERQYLWEIEHHGNLLVKHGFTPFLEALEEPTRRPCPGCLTTQVAVVFDLPEVLALRFGEFHVLGLVAGGLNLFSSWGGRAGGAGPSIFCRASWAVCCRSLF